MATKPNASQLRRLYEALAVNQLFPPATLAAAAGIDAAAVPAAVAALRKVGALVGGDEASGFRRELPPPLDGKTVATLVQGAVGREVFVYDEVATTMEVARRHAAGGAGDGVAVLAERQTAGRGRRGRSWASPSRLGLYLTVVLDRRRLPSVVGPLSLVAGVAAADACAPFVAVPVGLKWPNDLICENAKVGGVIIEALYEFDAVTVGVGVNVFHCPFDFPPGLPYTATSLAGVGGREVDRNALAASLLNSLDNWLSRWREYGAAAVIAAWRERNVTLGLRVRFAGSGVAGLAVDVTDDGALVVEDRAGRRHLIYAGDVVAEGN